MKKITIGRVGKNLSNTINIEIGRTSVLGNPFFMKNEQMRDEVCCRYELYFKGEMKKRREFYKEIARIYKLAKLNNINLQCFCAPKRCHGETIKKFLDYYLLQYDKKRTAIFGNEDEQTQFLLKTLHI